jgi:hypothetical protein
MCTQRLIARLASMAFLLVLLNGAAQNGVAQSLPAPVHLTSDQDQQRTMKLLHIDALRSGPQSNPDLPNAANYDESKMDPNPRVPDPLVLNNGTRVTTAQVWWTQRRPQIVEEFDREIYGRVPPNMPHVRWEVKSTVKEMNGELPVITKRLVGHVDNSRYPLIHVDIQVTLSTPANATRPVPVMMEYDVSAEDWARMAGPNGISMSTIANLMGEPIGNVMPSSPSWQHQVLAKGWGYASYLPFSVQADNGAGLTDGIIGLMNKGQPRTKPDDWGVLRAWSWGVSRVLDYFETDKSVDAKRVGLTGHSRFGKGALVGMAYDQRFAIGYISSSGEGGAKLFRRNNFGETIENVAAANEYHWMAPNFLKYAGPLTAKDLPVDADELIALCAPRPVFIGGGVVKMDGKWEPARADGWVDAKGMFMAEAEAGPVYRLLGKRDLGTTEFPATQTALIDGDLAFRQHQYGHAFWANWPTFLTFAGRYFN